MAAGAHRMNISHVLFLASDCSGKDYTGPLILNPRGSGGTCSRSPKLRGCPAQGLFFQILPHPSISPTRGLWPPNSISRGREPALLGEMAGSRTWEGKVQEHRVLPGSQELPKTTRAGSQGSVSDMKGLHGLQRRPSEHQKEWKDARQLILRTGFRTGTGSNRTK